MKFVAVRVLALVFVTLECSGDIKTRHTNIKCETLDKSVLEFPVCRLKVLGRGIIGASAHLKFRKLPLRSILINLSSWKRVSGYQPFLFNVTVDFCRYIKHPNPLNFFHYFYLGIRTFINLNHTCPYNHDIILKDFVLNDKMFAKVPFPKDSYMFSIKFATNGVWTGIINSYLDINVDGNPNIYF
nr:uncharacterized protein LOC108077905 [Drosophila kikkawai]